GEGPPTHGASAHAPIAAARFSVEAGWWGPDGDTRRRVGLALFRRFSGRILVIDQPVPADVILVFDGNNNDVGLQRAGSSSTWSPKGARSCDPQRESLFRPRGGRGAPFQSYEGTFWRRRRLK